jgi:hypothetical protein
MELVRRTTRWVVDFWGHLGTFVKVAGTVTALIGIGVTLTQTYKAVSGHFAARAAVEELRALANRQVEGSDYAAAWTSNARALELAPDDEAARQQQISIAKLWLQNARIAADSGPRSFSQLVAPLEETLIARGLKAQGPARADMEAHIAWARILRSRDSSRAPEIDGPIDTALQIDPQNAAAHAVRGYWRLSAGAPLPEVRRHFDRAIAGTGDKAFADRLVLTGWLNRWHSGQDYALGAIEYAGRLQRRGRSLGDVATQSGLMAAYEDGLRNRDYLERLTGILLPSDHAALLDSLTRTIGREGRRRNAEALRAFFIERSGNVAEARRIYEALIAAGPGESKLAHDFAIESYARLRH